MDRALHSPLSSGAIHSAKERAKRSNERPMKIRVRALQESVGTGDEAVDFFEFCTAMADTGYLLDPAHFLVANGNARVCIPSVFCSGVRPAELPSCRAACLIRALTAPTDGGATRRRKASLTNSTDDISDFSEGFSDISEVPLATLPHMSSNPRKDFETLGEAAARLIGVMDARRKRVSGAQGRPDQIERGDTSGSYERNRITPDAGEIAPPKDLDARPDENGRDATTSVFQLRQPPALPGGKAVYRRPPSLPVFRAAANDDHAALRSMTGVSIRERNS